MKPIDQTIFATDPARPGNCFAACVATVTGRPLHEVPHFVELGQLLHNGRRKDFNDPDRSRWHAMFLGFMAAHGMWPELIESVDAAEPGEIVFVGGPGPRGLPHQVLYRDGALWHDPHPSRAGLLSIDKDDIYVLRPSFFDHDPGEVLTGGGGDA